MSSQRGWESSVTRWKVTMGCVDSPHLKRVTGSVKSEKGFTETIKKSQGNRNPSAILIKRVIQNSNQKSRTILRTGG